MSAPALALIARFGFNWVATGQGVLRNSVNDDAVLPHHAFHLPGQHLKCFFRDDDLSDRITQLLADLKK